MRETSGAHAKPRVGIIVTAYNQGRYIDDALGSLRQQTFQDFIVHIVDDGSTDNFTPGKLATIDYDKAIVFQNKKNLGIARRQKEHYKKLDVDFIMTLCADDRLAPTYLEKCVQFLDSHPDFGAVGTSIQHFGADSNQQRLVQSECGLPMMLSANRFNGSALIRKKTLDEIDLGNEAIRYQDWDRWITILEAGWKLGVIDEFLFYYRQHESSLSHTATFEQELQVFRQIVNRHKKLYQKYWEQIYFDLQLIRLEAIERSRTIGALNKTLQQLQEELDGRKNENEELQSKLATANDLNARLSAELAEHLSIKRSARLLAGNVKRRIKHGKKP